MLLQKLAISKFCQLQKKKKKNFCMREKKQTNKKKKRKRDCQNINCCRQKVGKTEVY